ncbi:MAG: hypothetical protein U1A27_11635 [Phycisphaerae bacterium]
MGALAMPVRSSPAKQGLVWIGVALALLLAGLAWPGPARGQLVLYQQLPDRNFGLTSDTDYRDDAGHTQAAQTADSFALSSGGSVCGVNWWGFYGGSFVQFDPPPPGDETMRVRFYENTGGLPGAVLGEHTLVNPTREWTGQFVTGVGSPFRREYLYRAALTDCFAAAAGVTYWFEVVQVADVNSRFRWETSSQGDDDYALLFPAGTNWRISDPLATYDLAFSLITPEPSGLTLALCALLGVVRRR